MKSLALRTCLLVLAVTVSLSGCGRKKVAQVPTAPAPASGGGSSLVGGGPAPAQGAIRRGMEIQKAKQYIYNLKQFYEMFKTERNRPPANLKEFTDYFQRDDPMLVRLLQDGHFTMLFKPNLTGEAPVAYVTEPDGAGNRVVYQANGTIKVMNRTEFEAVGGGR